VPEAFDEFDPGDAPAPVGVDDPDERASISETRANYMGKVSLIEHYVGELIDALEERDALDDTLVVVTSDHGDMLGDDGIFDERHFHEQSVGVPLVMAGAGVETGEVPERQGGGFARKELVSLVDLHPTFLEAAGGERSHGDGDRDGRSPFGVIHGSADDRDRRDAVFAELGTTMTVRDGSHKLVYCWTCGPTRASARTGSATPARRPRRAGRPSASAAG